MGIFRYNLPRGSREYGADTVLLIRAKPSKRFLKLEVLEILARPRGRG